MTNACVRSCIHIHDHVMAYTKYGHMTAYMNCFDRMRKVDVHSKVSVEKNDIKITKRDDYSGNAKISSKFPLT